ncbi:hypothetical protein [Geomicrobium sp. JCM 19039]|uniref:hypothetical protein n=1 Tax=Geomicrobium sp. JCM 19039 TaxID=1460636 RepID=UPI00045F1D3B|nr:hypothetical protein [Geomicrobium sp. JCM 19039]GAK13685.1 hypothetical protein JCM19039_3552 [Geomicrobium sp. JCM 19039]
MKKLYVKAMHQVENVKATLKEEKGALSLEWVALGLLAIVFISVIIGYLADNSDGVGSAIVGKLEEFVEQIGSGE